MITCPDCGYENEDSAVACAGCGRDFGWAMRDAVPNKPDHRTGPEQPTSIADQQPLDERREISWLVYLLWAGIGIAMVMAGYFVGDEFCRRYEAGTWTYVTCLSFPLIGGVGVILGPVVGKLAHRGLRQVVHHYAAIYIATVFIAIIGTVLGYFMVITGCRLWDAIILR